MKFKYANQSVELVIEEGMMTYLDRYLPKENKIFVVTDEEVLRLYPQLFADFKYIHKVRGGEKSKSLDEATLILTALMDASFDKHDTIVAIGGGVVGDLTAFVASIYKRGMNLIFIPTTLISQVDSCLGGKTGVNFLGYKNQVGSIYHPKKILIDPNFLHTLPEVERVSGFAEVIKIAALFDEEMFTQLENQTYVLKDLIKRCLEWKAKVTLEDELDEGQRQLLNFGHTVGHAIEAKYGLPHGISIGYGMVKESANLRLQRLLEQFGFDFSKEFTGLEEYITHDKKRKHNKIIKIVLVQIGKAKLEEGLIDEYFS